MKRLLLLLFVTSLFSCTPQADESQKIIGQAIAAHGCKAQKGKTITFTFRDRNYSMTRENGNYVYTRSFSDSTGTVVDSLVNSSDFTRYRNGASQGLTEEWATKYANSVNSVLYFFQLPCLLDDSAVITSYEGNTEISNEKYNVIRVTFKTNGGGEDFQDVYFYWIHAEKKTLDYLAYNYQTNGGGTRFRQAINRKTIDGMIFQDYINYTPDEKFPPLASLPVLFEDHKLIELSRIINVGINIQ